MDLFKYFFTTPAGAIVLAGIFISLSIVSIGFINTDFTKTKFSKTTVIPNVPNIANNPAQTPPGEDSGPVKVSVDDDPVLGDKNAPLTLIEFSDYECPFCKRHYTQTYPSIKKDYIDTGKVKLIYRDLPLEFHRPLAVFEAIAANCAREQGGDEMYFKYHDEIFNRTNSNGNGMPKDELYKIASDLRLNTNDFKSCLDSEKYKGEIDKDFTDAGAAGASGTPTLFLGKSTSDGFIDGIRIVGAQPYSVFKTLIDQQLSK